MTSKFRLTLILLLAFPLLQHARAQQTANVTATITDASGQTWNNGTYTAVFKPLPGNPGPYVTNPGGAAFTTRFTGSLSAGGALSISNMQRNDFIAPSGSLWTFTVCPQASSACFTQDILINSASPNLSSALIPPGISITAATRNSFAYNDSEIGSPTLGVMYTNITDGQMHFCSALIAGVCTWAIIPNSSSGTFINSTLTGTTTNAGTITGGAINPSTADIGALTATSPAFTPTSIESIVLADQYHASGSAEATTGTIAATSPVLTMTSALDFEDGEGVAVAGAGASAFGGAAITAPTPTITNFCGLSGLMACTPGGTTYNYKVVAVDGAEGYTAAGAAGSTATGAANLGYSNNNTVTGANVITWSAPSGITSNDGGYFVYGEKSGDAAYQLIAMVTIPGYAQPWAASTAYAMGRYVRPKGSPNGSYYVATTGGTAGSSEPSWCTSSSTCTTTDGTITWQRQPFSWMDECTDSTGTTGCTAALTYAPAWVPQTPPSAGAADTLVTTITSGGGATALTLAASASQTVSGTAVRHSDGTAIEAAVTAQGTECINTQPAGFAAAYSCPPIWIPTGTYNVDGQIPVSAAIVIHSNSDATINFENPFADGFVGSVYTADIERLSTLGGRTPYVFTEVSDNDVLHLANIQARYSTDYVAEFLGSAGSGGDATVQCTCVADRMYFYSGIDWLTIQAPSWIEPVMRNLQPWEAQIEALGTHTTLSGVVTAGVFKPYDRLLDAWGDVTIGNGTRIGADPNGESAVYSFGGGVSITNSAVGTNTDTTLANSPSVGIIDTLNQTFPTRITYGSNPYVQTSPLIDTCNGINTRAPCILPAGFTPTNLDTVFNATLTANQTPYSIVLTQTEGAGLLSQSLQPALVPYVIGSALDHATYGAPTSGIWRTPSSFNQGYGNWVFNRAPSPLAYTIAATFNGLMERAAPTWAATTGYTLASSPYGEGHDYVTDGAGHVFYVSAVSSGTTCISNGSAPSWNTASGDTTPDGTCTWTTEGTNEAAIWLPVGAGLNGTLTANTLLMGNGGSGITLSTETDDGTHFNVGRAAFNFLPTAANIYAASSLGTSTNNSNTSLGASGFCWGLGTCGTTIPSSSAVLQFAGTLTTTAAASDNLSVAGMTSAGHCQVQATNATAAALTGVTCVTGSGLVTVAHSATAAGTFSVFVTFN